jgi:hypothetical protein
MLLDQQEKKVPWKVRYSNFHVRHPSFRREANFFLSLLLFAGIFTGVLSFVVWAVENDKTQARERQEQLLVNDDPKVDWVRRDGLEYRCNDGNMIYSNGASIKDDERCQG